MNFLTRIVLLLLTLSVSLPCLSQQFAGPLSDQTREIVEKIAKVNEVMGSAVSIAGTMPKQYENFNSLKEIATRDELLYLTDHPNGVVRCYAFWAIRSDNPAQTFPILLNHIDDNERVSTLFGCSWDSLRVGDFFVDMVRGSVERVPDEPDLLLLTMLDSILIYRPNELIATSDALSRIAPEEQHYARIRQLAVERGIDEAYVTLAKYRREQDVPLIIDLRSTNPWGRESFSYTYRAIQIFPHPDFFPILERHLLNTLDNTRFSDEWQELYKAIAAYRNRDALELLRIPFTGVKFENIRKYHMNFLFDALRETPDPVYEDLLWRLWRDENRITPNIFEHLREVSQEKAYRLAIRDVFRPNALSFKYDKTDGAEQLLAGLLTWVLERDRDLGYEAIRSGIAKADVFMFPVIAKMIAVGMDTAFVEPLFDRLRKEWNSHVYLEVAKLLISYQSADVNRRILEVRKENGELTEGWGGNNLTKLLREHGIL